MNEAEYWKANARVYSPAERAAMTDGRLVGRATSAQMDTLADLGVPRERSMMMTKHAASKEIERRLNRRATRRQQHGK